MENVILYYPIKSGHFWLSGTFRELKCSSSVCLSISSSLSEPPYITPVSYQYDCITMPSSHHSFVLQYSKTYSYFIPLCFHDFIWRTVDKTTKFKPGYCSIISNSKVKLDWSMYAKAKNAFKFISYPVPGTQCSVLLNIKFPVTKYSS